ncbi:MAG: hypothetical protein C4520_07725 [Candidatus Abyssobacteria bacterium SURF_5]|jgi:hypothetical protein|uniref:Uncharacterized protein n=1 Tax=Abyssobacteria bacterium (strain SURF_5) TaxID=2093360 RepID=A0A3A4NQ86_ABYX5|nr:MAG: hypothetical protein C4520_07725 [Candidatus Abyssubacteria bacterium SURF_5]
MPKRKKAEFLFKTCDCGRKWKTRNEFLQDKSVKIAGYQPDFINGTYNHFLFQHRAKGCGGFLAVRASDFADLREEPCSAHLCTGHENCPGYCMNTLDLRVCSVACRNAADRQVASKLGNRRLMRALFPAIEPDVDAKPAKQKARSHS